MASFSVVATLFLLIGSGEDGRQQANKKNNNNKMVYIYVCEYIYMYRYTNENVDGQKHLYSKHIRKCESIYA